jgi:predicted aldo/keto reductase-like oxidoreductase
VKQRTLGRTGLTAGRIGLGTEYLVDVPRRTVLEVVHAAVEAGVNYFDVLFAPPHYRDNFGAALGPVRERVLIAGHLGAACQDGQYRLTRDPAECEAWFEDLLVRLGTDYVDVLFVSNCDEQADYDAVMAPGGSLELARRLRDDGKARAIAISGHRPDVAEQAAGSGAFDVLMHVVNLSGDAEPQRKRLYHTCAAEGVAVVAMKPFAGGVLLQDRGNGPPPTPVQCLAYALAQPAVVMAIPGVKSTDELAAALAVLSADDAERDFSAALARFQQPVRGQCVYCNHCLPCPAGIDVGRTIRLLDTAGERPDAGAVAEYANLPVKPSACTECGACVQRCPFEVDAMARVRRAAAVFEAAP